MTAKPETETEHCPKCREHTTRTEDGGCVLCGARTARAEAQARQEELKARERARFELQPLTRSLSYARIGIEGSVSHRNPHGHRPDTVRTRFRTHLAPYRVPPPNTGGDRGDTPGHT